MATLPQCCHDITAAVEWPGAWVSGLALGPERLGLGEDRHGIVSASVPAFSANLRLPS
jgi:hypothetical protein